MIGATTIWYGTPLTTTISKVEQAVASLAANNRYDVILRTGQAGDGTSATVPESNRLEPYPNGIKREYFPTFDQIDSITRLYDIVREGGSEDGTVDGLTLDVTTGVLTVTIERTVGADDIVADRNAAKWWQ